MALAKAMEGVVVHFDNAAMPWCNLGRLLRLASSVTLPLCTSEAFPRSFFARPAELVAPDLVGCRLVKRQTDGSLLWGVVVEMEAYSQDDPACHGYRRLSPSNETLFGEPGRFYVYLSYGIHHCRK